MRGFTLIEVIIAIGIFGILLSAAAPFTARVYRGFLVTSEARTFVYVLRRAETRAMSNIGGQAHGVSWQLPDFVLFRGGSYASRDADFDETYDVDGSVAVSGAFDVVFAAGSGLPSATGTWVFSDAVTSSSVVLNAVGAVTW